MLFYIIMGRWEIYQQIELKLKDVEIELAKKKYPVLIGVIHY